MINVATKKNEILGFPDETSVDEMQNAIKADEFGTVEEYQPTFYDRAIRPALEAAAPGLDIFKPNFLTTQLPTAEEVMKPVTDTGWNFLIGVNKSVIGIDKLVMADKIPFFKESIEIADKQNALASEIVAGDNGFTQFLNQTAQGMGELTASIPLWEALGAATVASLSGRLGATATKYLKAMPEFAIGMGEEAVVQKVEEGKPEEALMAGVTKMAEGLTFSKMGSGPEMFPKMISFNVAAAEYSALKENRFATKDEIRRAIADGVAWSVALSIPGLFGNLKKAKERMKAVREDYLANPDKDAEIAVNLASLGHANEAIKDVPEFRQALIIRVHDILSDHIRESNPMIAEPVVKRSATELIQNVVEEVISQPVEVEVLKPTKKSKKKPVEVSPLDQVTGSKELTQKFIQNIAEQVIEKPKKSGLAEKTDAQEAPGSTIPGEEGLRGQQKTVETKNLKRDLINQIEQAKSQADGEGFVSFKHPGGEYRIENTFEALNEFGNRIETGKGTYTDNRGKTKTFRPVIPKLSNELGSLDLSQLPTKEQVLEAKDDLYSGIINRFQPIENVVEKAKKLGAKIQEGENAALLARQYLGIGRKADTIIQYNTVRNTPDGKVEITGEGYRPILDDYSRQNKHPDAEKDLDAYQKAVRTVEDLQRPKSEWDKEHIATPKQVADSKKTLLDLEAKYGDLKLLEDTAKRLYGYRARVLHMLVDSGDMSQEMYDSILAKNPHYVPFDRVLESADVEGGMPVSKKPFTGARSPVKKIKGSDLEIHNTVESDIKNTYRILDAAERNMVAKSVAKLEKFLPDDVSDVPIKMVPVATIDTPTGKEPIFRPSQFKPKGDVIEYFDDGKRKYVKVSRDVYEAMTGLNEVSVGMLTKILAFPARLLRAGATITPEFATRNPIRDQYTAFLQTNVGFIPFVDTAKAIGDVLKKSEAYKDWLRSGGAYSGFVELSRENLKKETERLLKDPSLLSRLNIVTDMQDISQLFEQATRVAVYKRGIGKGMSQIRAGFESREATVDFGRRGSKTKDINAVIAFFNAGIQGTDKMVRSAIKDPVGLTIKGVSTITIPSILSYLLNKDDPGYHEIPRWQKDLFWIFRVKDAYVRIPKPFAYGQVFGSVPERFMEYLDTKDPDSFKGLLDSLYSSVSPVSGDPASGLLATAAKPLIENATNWSFFKDRSLVSESRKDLLPADQYDKYTSETSKKIGELINYSPAKIDNLITGWLGGSGRYATDAIDLAMKAATGKGKAKRPIELADIPLIKGFVTRPPESQSQSEKTFYENRKNITSAYQSVKASLKERNVERAEKLKKQHPEIAYYKAVNDAAETLSDLKKYSDMIIKSDKPDSEKRELLKKIDHQIVTIAKNMNERMKK
jgi:hypothetical protein